MEPAPLPEPAPMPERAAPALAVEDETTRTPKPAAEEATRGVAPSERPRGAEPATDPVALAEDPSELEAGEARSAELDRWDGTNDEILTSAYAFNPDIQEQVDFWLDFWQGRGREYFQRYLHRMVMYQPIVDRELKERGLPWSLRYLPVIESGFSPTAVSRVGATGLWQFMSPTARWLGLRVDGFIDERRDPYRSTETALDYLTTLRGDFGSWFLALAAYNSGPGRVGGILRRHAPDAPRGDSLFWALSDRFPDETSLFVPKLLAASEMATHPGRYGFEAPNPGDSLQFELVEVPDATSLDVVAEAAGIDTEDVVAMNPHLVQRVTPMNTPWTVRVPVGRADGFAARLAEIPREDRVTFVQHRVASGETLSHIAERYGIRVSNLTAANPGVSPRRLQIGQNLIVPAGPATSAVRTASRAAAGPTTGATDRASPSRPVTRTAATTQERVTHVVRSGESPWIIAREYGVFVGDLLAWNGLREGSIVRPGDRLDIRGATVTTYRVRVGDTLSEIAERHGVSTRALAAVNGLSLRSVIRAGQSMKIPPRS